MGSSQACEVWNTHAASARVSHLSLQASPSRGGAVSCSLVGGGVFVLLHGLPENRVDLFEMVDAFAEFALFAHQYSIASLQFLKAQAQRVLLFAPVCSMGRAMAALPLKLSDRRVKYLAVFEQIERLGEVQRLRALCTVMSVRMDTGEQGARYPGTVFVQLIMSQAQTENCRCQADHGEWILGHTTSSSGTSCASPAASVSPYRCITLTYTLGVQTVSLAMGQPRAPLPICKAWGA